MMCNRCGRTIRAPSVPIDEVGAAYGPRCAAMRRADGLHAVETEARQEGSGSSRCAGSRCEADGIHVDSTS